MRLSTRLRYFIWSASHGVNPDTSCPGCGSPKSRCIGRKLLVTALFECAECGLRFRVPKDDESISQTFYQSEYEEGFTTGMPSREELAGVLAKGFAEYGKDYSGYVEVFRAAGVGRGALVLDYGCSWGYGSYQLRQAGYDVLSYEISKPRATYAASVLGLTVIEDPTRPQVPVDCVFSAHVMEHLPDPNRIWRVAASALKPAGVFVAFFPNGDPDTEGWRGRKRYHQLWGKVHPLVITGRHLKYMAHRHGFRANVYSSPYPLEQIASLRDGPLTGDEGLVVARRNST